jgi:hypothetical protein
VQHIAQKVEMKKEGPLQNHSNNSALGQTKHEPKTQWISQHQQQMVNPRSLAKTAPVVHTAVP